jgi:hypothetical protein
VHEVLTAVTQQELCFLVVAAHPPTREGHGGEARLERILGGKVAKESGLKGFDRGKPQVGEQ